MRTTWISSLPVPAAVLAACIEDDCRVVNAWPALAPTPAACTDDPAAAASQLGPAFVKLHREQKERWEAAEVRRQQLEALRAEVAAARAALSPVDSPHDPAAADAAARTLLAAQQAGLRAELECLSRAQQASEAAAAAAAQRAEAVRAAQAQAAALEAREAVLDDAVRALCSADGQVMRQWRQGTWRAQEAVETGVLARREPLAALAERLAQAQGQELAAFREHAGHAAAKRLAAGGEHPAAAPAAPASAADGSPAGSQATAAAQLLDPLAGLKTEAAAQAAVAAAQAELQELRPAGQQWAELATAAASRLAALQATAAELEGQVAALQQAGSAETHKQLQAAASAAEEGAAVIAHARQALTEWWTSPAVTATPWVKREQGLLGRAAGGGNAGGMDGVP